AGLVAALLLSRTLSGLLYGVSAHDPLYYLTAPLMLGLIALFACYLPARRAAEVEPAGTLRGGAREGTPDYPPAYPFQSLIAPGQVSFSLRAGGRLCQAVKPLILTPTENWYMLIYHSSKPNLNQVPRAVTINSPLAYARRDASIVADWGATPPL